MTKTQLLQILMGGSAILALAAMPVHADAAAKKAASSPSEVRELRQEVEMLKAELNSMKQQMQQTQQSAETAAADAEAAKIKALAAQGKANAAIDTAKTGGDLGKSVAWAKDTKVGGTMFFNLSNIHQRTDNGTAVGQKNGTGLQVKRFYLSIDHKFDDVWSANLTTDFNDYTVFNSAKDANGTTLNAGNTAGGTLYVKKAYLQGKFDDALIVRIGSNDQPWIAFVDGFTGLRYVENSLVDRTKFGNSTDWGVHVLGKFADGLVGYQISAVNGGGYRKANVRSKNIDLEGRIDVHPMKDITLAVGGYTGHLDNGSANTNGGGANPTTVKTAQRVDAMIGYSHKYFRIGGEYFWAKNYGNTVAGGAAGSGVALAAASEKADGWSLFASVFPMKDVSIFGRYDWVKPTKDARNSFKDDYFNFGAAYTPTKGVDLALVYKREKVEDGVFNTTNGSIGRNAIGGSGTYDEVGVWGQVKF